MLELTGFDNNENENQILMKFGRKKKDTIYVTSHVQKAHLDYSVITRMHLNQKDSPSIFHQWMVFNMLIYIVSCLFPNTWFQMLL